jgi:hypothetical protein
MQRQASSAMEERLPFVDRLLDGDHLKGAVAASGAHMFPALFRLTARSGSDCSKSRNLRRITEKRPPSPMSIMSARVCLAA